MTSDGEVPETPLSTPGQLGDGEAKGPRPGYRNPPQHLRDMRRVYKHPESADETASQKAMRKLMIDDFSKFIGMLQSAEKVHAGGRVDRSKQVGPVATPEAPEDDERDVEVDELIDRCLADALRVKGA